MFEWKFASVNRGACIRDFTVFYINIVKVISKVDVSPRSFVSYQFPNFFFINLTHPGTLKDDKNTNPYLIHVDSSEQFKGP